MALAFALYGANIIRPTVLAAIALAHLLHVLSGLATLIPAGSRIHLQALRRPALRYLFIQAITLTLAALAWLLPRTSTPALLEVIALLGITATAALFARRVRPSVRVGRPAKP